MPALFLLLLLSLGPREQKLVGQMGDRSFVRRQVASWKLYELGPERAWLSMAMAARHRDPEIRKRAERILNEWRLDYEREHPQPVSCEGEIDG